MRPLLFVFSLVWTSLLGGEEITGRVIGVADGDTITVLDANRVQHKIRLEGIDAPERGQAYGTKATDALKGVLGKEAKVTVKITDKDRYGRSIGRVFIDQTDINSWMVTNGWAWHYKKYSKDAALASLETKAKATRKGLWADSSPPIAPWDYRSAKRQQRAVKLGDAAPLGWWINTGSNVRHNSTCRFYGKTSMGRECTKNEGKACGICGG